MSSDDKPEDPALFTLDDLNAATERLKNMEPPRYKPITHHVHIDGHLRDHIIRMEERARLARLDATNMRGEALTDDEKARRVEEFAERGELPRAHDLMTLLNQVGLPWDKVPKP